MVYLKKNIEIEYRTGLLKKKNKILFFSQKTCFGNLSELSHIFFQIVHAKTKKKGFFIRLNPMHRLKVMIFWKFQFLTGLSREPSMMGQNHFRVFSRIYSTSKWWQLKIFWGQKKNRGCWVGIVCPLYGFDFACLTINIFKIYLLVHITTVTRNLSY